MQIDPQSDDVDSPSVINGELPESDVSSPDDDLTDEELAELERATAPDFAVPTEFEQETPHAGSPSTTAIEPVIDGPADTQAMARGGGVGDGTSGSDPGANGIGGADGTDRQHQDAVPDQAYQAEVAEQHAVIGQDVDDASGTERVDDDTATDGGVVDDRLAMPLPRIIAIANQKGGVGKTTTTVNIAACLAEQGYRTLLVDLDPQANASTGLGLEPRELEYSIYHVMLHDQPADSCIEPTDVKNLFVLPSSLDLAGAEIELVSLLSREHRLRMAIETVIDDYDYVLIDCPPSLGLLTINALAAAREVVVPIQCEYYALEGLGQLMRNVELVRASLNPTLQISHIVLVMFDPRTKLAGQVVDEVRAHFGATVCANVIPRTVRLSEAPSFGQPITTFDTDSRGAAAYRAVTQEVLDGQA